VQRCGIKSETQAAHCATQMRQLQLENGVLRLEQAALAASLAAANAACQRQQDELQALRAALHTANVQRACAHRDADELRSKFEVALQVQLVCLKGHDQAKGQLDAALTVHNFYFLYMRRF
jgi:chromosome segregation ATPase